MGWFLLGFGILFATAVVLAALKGNTPYSREEERREDERNNRR